MSSENEMSNEMSNEVNNTETQNTTPVVFTTAKRGRKRINKTSTEIKNELLGINGELYKEIPLNKKKSEYTPEEYAFVLSKRREYIMKAKEKKPEQTKEYFKNYYLQNKEKFVERAQKRYNEKREEITEKAREYVKVYREKLKKMKEEYLTLKQKSLP